MKNIIEQIQDDDPSYDPLKRALVLSKTDRDLWNAACSRVYSDGYYGPISPAEWEEQDGRKPYTVKEAIEVIKTVLNQVEPYQIENEVIDDSEIKAALIPFWREIYGTGYPS